MHKHLHLIIFTVFCLLIHFTPGFAQISSIDSASNNQAFKKALNYYDKATIKNGAFYIGADYQYYPASIKGDAYYPSFNWQKGMLLYDHVSYYSIPLLYDVYKDIVVIQPGDADVLFSAVSDKIERFTIGNHNFKRIVADSVNNTIKTGFYEILYTGKTEVILRKEKSIQKSSATDRYFDEATEYYIKHANGYYKISSKGSMFNLLKDKKDELQQNLKKTDLNFRRQKEQAIIQTALYYDQVTK